MGDRGERPMGVGIRSAQSGGGSWGKAPGKRMEICGEHLSDKGDSQESVEVTLAKTPSSGVCGA